MKQVREPWPKHGPDFNNWEENLIGFMQALDAARGQYWWCEDMPLKYLEIRIDTRDNGFILRDRDGNRVDPNRVLDAIDSWTKKFPNAEPIKRCRPTKDEAQ